MLLTAIGQADLADRETMIRVTADDGQARAEAAEAYQRCTRLFGEPRDATWGMVVGPRRRRRTTDWWPPRVRRRPWRRDYLLTTPATPPRERDPRALVVELVAIRVIGMRLLWLGRTDLLWTLCVVAVALDYCRRGDGVSAAEIGAACRLTTVAQRGLVVRQAPSEFCTFLPGRRASAEDEFPAQLAEARSTCAALALLALVGPKHTGRLVRERDVQRWLGTLPLWQQSLALEVIAAVTEGFAEPGVGPPAGILPTLDAGPVAWARAGTVLLLAAEHTRALAVCRTALERYPDCPALWRVMATVFDDVGPVDEGIACSRRYLEACPGSWRVRAQLAYQLLRASEPAAAAAEFRRSLTLRNSGSARHGLGNALWELSDHDSAIAEWRIAASGAQFGPAASARERLAACIAP